MVVRLDSYLIHMYTYGKMMTLVSTMIRRKINIICLHETK